MKIIFSITSRLKLFLPWLHSNDGMGRNPMSGAFVCSYVFPGLTFLMIVEINWMQKFMLASWWDTMKSQNPINCLISSDERLLSNVMFGLMRILPESSCWIPPLCFCMMLTLMLSRTLFLLLLSSFLRLVHRILYLFLLECQSLSWLVQHLMFQLVHQLYTLWILIILLKWTTVHLFLIFPIGIPILLKLLELILEMHLAYEKPKERKKYVNVSLMFHVFKTYDLLTFSNVEGWPKGEQAMNTGIDSLSKDQT